MQTRPAGSASCVTPYDKLRGSLLVLAVAGACRTETIFRDIDTLVVSRDSLYLVRHASETLYVKGVRNHLDTVDVAATFSSTDPGCVAVDRFGIVRSVGPECTATVTVRAEQRSVSLPATVIGIADSVHVAPGDTSLTIGDSLLYHAAVYDTGGELLPTRQILWNSSDTLAARLSPNGVATAAGDSAKIVGVSAFSGPNVGIAILRVVHP